MPIRDVKMGKPASELVSANQNGLLGYELGLKNHEAGYLVFAPQSETDFEKMQRVGIPAIYPLGGKWLSSHAELVSGWELVFAFTTPEYRIKVGRIIDGYARQTFILTDEKTGSDNLSEYLRDNPSSVNGLIALSDRAAPYEYREEEQTRASIIPLEGQETSQAPYPIDALGPIIGAMAKSIVSNNQVSAPLAAQSVLGVASLVAQQYANVQPPYHAEPIACSLYLLTIADSGERKSAANNAALAPVKKWERRLAETFEIEFTRYRRAKSAYDKLVKKEEEKAKTVSEALDRIEALGKEPRVPLSPSVILNEPTIEGFLKSAEHSHAGRAIITDEAGAILGGHSMTKEKKQHTFTTLSKLWDASSITMLRAGRETPPVKGKRLTIHLLGQSIIIEPLLADPLAQGQGFLARFLMTSAPPLAGFRKLQARPTPADCLASMAWTDHIYKFLTTRTPNMKRGTDNELNPAMLILSDDAYKVWSAFANEVETEQRPERKYAEIKPFASKAAEHALRLAGIFTVLEHLREKTVIDAETMQRSVLLSAYYADAHLRLVRLCSEDPIKSEAKRLFEWVKANRGQYFYQADLSKFGPNSIRIKAKLEECLSTLCDHKYIKMTADKRIDGSLRKNCFEVLG